MLIKGTFKDITNTNAYYVSIGTDIGVPITIKDSTDEVYENGNYICFAADPVVLESDLSDTFTNLYIRECTVTLMTNYDIKNYVTANNNTDIPIEIRKTNENGNIIFKGFVLPMNYNQAFALKWNTVELNCIDRLGILQYMKFPTLYWTKHPGTTSVEYTKPRDIINWCLEACGFANANINIDIDNDLTNATLINPTIFFGESEDDWYMCDEVLNELGKLYGFYVWCDGDTCYIENRLFKGNTTTITATKDDYSSNDMNLSIDQAYNQIRLTCNIDSIDDTIVDPFDEDNLISPYNKRQRYMTEHICAGTGQTAYQAFNCILSGITPIYDGLETKDHYCQVKVNNMFDFGQNGYTSLLSGNSLPEQWEVLDWLNTHPGKAAFISYGHTSNLTDYKDTAISNDLSMTDYFVISIKGQYEGSAVNGGTGIPSQTNILNGSRMESQIQANNPLCSMTLPDSINFIPQDEGTTNYLVFSGKILLNPLQPKTGPIYSDLSYGSIGKRWSNWGLYGKSTNNIKKCIQAQNIPIQQQVGFWNSDVTLYKRVVPVSSNNDGAYYQQRYYDSDGEVYLSPDGYQNWIQSYDNDLQVLHGPLDNDKNKMLKYDYSSDESAHDNIDKLSIICCELKIGDKYCVERLDLGEGGQNLFQWLTAEECTQLGIEPVFTLGINPAIGDTIVGSSKDISNNIMLQMGLDAKGTAIPIRFSDHLSGQFQFKILGPYNLMYDEVTKKTHRKWIFWKYTTSSHNSVPVLECLENILISDFKIDLVTDNQAGNKNDKNDLVYYSRSNTSYYESYDYEVNFCTALTSAEAQEKGIDFGITNSNVMKIENNELVPFYGFDYADTVGTVHENTKLEEARVYEQYNYWKQPKEIVEVSLKLDNPQNIVPKKNYQFNYLKNSDNSLMTFRPIGNEVSLWRNTQKVKMKQI